MMKKAMIIGSLAALLTMTVVGTSNAGDLDSPGTPPATGSNMPTLTDIYDQLDSGTTATAALFQEATATATAGTGRSLAEIATKLPVPDNATGATPAQVTYGRTFYGIRSDGTWGLQTGTMDVSACKNGKLTP